MATVEERFAALEARVSDIETGYGKSIRCLERDAVATCLNMRKILAYMRLTPATDEEIDAELDRRGYGLAWVRVDEPGPGVQRAESTLVMPGAAGAYYELRPMETLWAVTLVQVLVDGQTHAFSIGAKLSEVAAKVHAREWERRGSYDGAHAADLRKPQAEKEFRGTFGLDNAEIRTLVRLAAATADESNRNPNGGEYDRALTSFTDPAEVHRLAASTWARIEQD